MKTLTFSCLLSLGTCLSARAANLPEAYIIDTRKSPHAVLHQVPLDAVEWTTGFWADRYRQLCDITLQTSWKLLDADAAGHVTANFRAAGSGQGQFAGTAWQDEWMYKWLEAASCVWRSSRSDQLLQQMDGAIALVAKAQQPDGYISTNITVGNKKRFVEARNHELYNMGHLLTAGVINHRMTGQTQLLDVARRAGDFMVLNVGKTVEPYFAHNPSAIMGLVELYRETGEKKYLECAELIVDKRGTKPKRQGLFAMATGMNGTDEIQDRVPVRDSSEIVGHNVFFTYLYSGASDIYAETGDAPLESALERLWGDLVNHKMFIHGGVSAEPQGVSNNAPVNEAAGPSYYLPNAGCYNETCGQIGCFMWAARMNDNRPQAQFADIMEREMFNGFLGAQSLGGDHWFYRNVIRRYDDKYESGGWTDMVSRGQPGRKEICCPSNLLRTMAELSAYIYSVDDKGLWVNQYGGSKVHARVGEGKAFALEQVTDYPWSGEVDFKVSEAPAGPAPLHLRIPSWVDAKQVRVDGKPISSGDVAHGYLMLDRRWRAGDRFHLSLPMPVQEIAANPMIEETRNQVAIMRGPILYCVESADLPKELKVENVYLARNATGTTEPGLKGAASPLARSLQSVELKAWRRTDAPWQTLYRPIDPASAEPFNLTLIPYFSWANRGKSTMSVWIPLGSSS